MQILREIYEQTGVRATELDEGPPLPNELVHVWRWFGDLSRARTSGFSIDAICWTEIATYFALMKITPMWWELEALRRIDDAFLESRLSKPAIQISSAKAMASSV